jgi:hypothetical protein
MLSAVSYTIPQKIILSTFNNYKGSLVQDVGVGRFCFVIKLFDAETCSSWHLTWCMFCDLCFIIFYLVQFVVSCIFTSTEIRNTVSLKPKDMFKSKLSRFLGLCGSLLITQSQCLKDKMFFIKDSGGICWYSVARKTLLNNKWRNCRWKVKIWHKKNMYEKKLHTDQQ